MRLWFPKPGPQLLCKDLTIIFPRNTQNDAKIGKPVCMPGRFIDLQRHSGRAERWLPDVYLFAYFRVFREL